MTALAVCWPLLALLVVLLALAWWARRGRVVRGGGFGVSWIGERD